MALITIDRYHDFCMGHRVMNHEGKCKHVHGHNYRVHITAKAPKLDKLGRVIDFSMLKSICCEWIEDTLDHKFMVYIKDASLVAMLKKENPDGMKIVSFNPTAENIAEYLFKVFNSLLAAENYPEVKVTKIKLEETRKCSATYEGEYK